MLSDNTLEFRARDSLINPIIFIICPMLVIRSGLLDTGFVVLIVILLLILLLLLLLVILILILVLVQITLFNFPSPCCLQIIQPFLSSVSPPLTDRWSCSLGPEWANDRSQAAGEAEAKRE